MSLDNVPVADTTISITLEDCVEVLDNLRKPVNNSERLARIENKKANELYPYYGATGQVGWIDDYLFDGEFIALGEDGVPFLDPFKNKAYMLHGKTWVNNHAHVLLAIKGVSINKYIFYFLNYFDYLGYVNGGTRLKLTQANMRKIPINLPSLNEQQEIVHQLDVMLAQVEQIKARLDAIPAILKKFRQSILADAVSGRLTEDQANNQEWIEKPLSEVASHVVDCPHSTPKWSESGKICVRTTGFKPFFLDLSEQGFVSEEVFNQRNQRLVPQENDILYSREGTVGIACQIPIGVELCLGQRMVLIRAGKSIDDKFLTIVLNSNKILEIVRSKTMGSTAPRVNMSDIRAYPIPLPSLDEQRVIVSKVETFLNSAKNIESLINSAQKRVNLLTQSILAKAFSGELTAEWREQHQELITGINSAESLLAKIQAEREASKPAKKTRKKKEV